MMETMCFKNGKPLRSDYNYHRWYRECNARKIADYSKKYREVNRVKFMFLRAKNRASERGLEFSISVDDIVIPEVCPVLGIPLLIGNKKVTDNSPTLDRIDSSKGYVRGNVCVISHKANVIKNFGNIEDHEKIINYMKSFISVNNEDCEYFI